jgi:hypothetical protein
MLHAEQENAESADNFKGQREKRCNVQITTSLRM